MSVELLTPTSLQTSHGIVEIPDGRPEGMFDADFHFQLKHYAELGVRGGWSRGRFTRELGAGSLNALYYHQEFPTLRRLAIYAAERLAVSYRGFHVGAAACASAADGRQGIFFAGNYKPYEGGPRECAEARVASFAEEHKYDRIHAMFLYGPDNFLDVDPFSTSTTLHPCGVTCRPMFRDHLDTGLFRKDTVLVTESYAGKREAMDLASLLELHAEQDGAR